MTRSWISSSVEETREIGRTLAGELAPDGCLLLIGDLGTGKTALVQGLAAGLGLDPAAIQSPTFTLLAEHRGRGATLLHLDLYRLESEQVEATGFEEVLSGRGVKAVEWADRLPFRVPGARTIQIEKLDGERRLEEVGAPEAANRWNDSEEER